MRTQQKTARTLCIHCDAFHSIDHDDLRRLADRNGEKPWPQPSRSRIELDVIMGSLMGRRFPGPPRRPAGGPENRFTRLPSALTVNTKEPRIRDARLFFDKASIFS